MKDAGIEAKDSIAGNVRAGASRPFQTEIL